MDKKKILIVTKGFYPENSPRSFRSTELAKEFCRQGHIVTVYTPERADVSPLLQEYPIRLKSLGKLSWKIPHIQSDNKIIKLLNRAIARLLSLLVDYPNIELFFKVKKHLRAEKNHDLLISVAVPFSIHWGVAAIWKSAGDNPAKVWAADCGDPYMTQENDSFQPPFYFGWVEKWFCRKVDYLTVPTPNSYKGYYEEFHNKIKVIPQGFRFEDVQLSKTIPSSDKIIFGYGGSFILNKRDPRELLDFLATIQYDYEFHIYSSHREIIESYLLSNNKIVLHAPIPRLELLSKLSEYHFVVNFANQGVTQLPSKLIDYAILQKPILEIETGNLDKVKVEAFLNGDYKDSLVIRDSHKYRIENITSDFLALLGK